MTTTSNQINSTQVQMLANLALAAPAIAAVAYTLPKAIDPESNWAVSTLANCGTRLLFLVQSVVLVVALPFSLMWGLFSMYFREKSVLEAGLIPTAYAALIPATFFAAVIPQSSLSQVSEWRTYLRDQLGGILENANTEEVVDQLGGILENANTEEVVH